MGIQVPLLVIDRRRVSVMSTLFSNRRVGTLKVTMTVIMSLCILMYQGVRSPGCDHGHDEESRNGRDIKIDILDGYVRTSEWFREVSDITGVPEGLSEPPGGSMGLIGPRGEREGRARRWRPPHEESELDKEGGRGPPFPLPLPLLSFPFSNPSWTRKGESYSHREEDSLSLGAPLEAGRPPVCSFIYGGRGAPQRHTS